MKDNNLETPKVDGQEDKTVKEEVKDEAVEEATTETEAAEDKGKNIPDDPKLLRKKMTQATQETAEMKDKLEQLSKYPKIKEILDEIETGKAPEPAKPKAEPTLEDLDDEKKGIYGNLVPFFKIFMTESGYGKKVDAVAQTTKDWAIRTMVADFQNKHKEAKEPEVMGALTDIINAAGKMGERISLDSAWKIYKSDTAESVATKKVRNELEAKKDISLPKPSGTQVTNTVKGRMSAKQAIREALKTQK